MVEDTENTKLKENKGELDKMEFLENVLLAGRKPQLYTWRSMEDDQKHIFRFRN